MGVIRSMPRILKLIVISLLVFIIFFMAFSFLLPNKIIVSRAIDVDKPKAQLDTLLYTCNGWMHWLDTGITNNVTSVSANKLSTANLQVNISNQTADKIYSVWKKNNEQPIYSLMQIISYANNPNKTTVQWQFTLQFKWYNFSQKFAALVSDEVLGKLMENNLKRIN